MCTVLIARDHEAHTVTATSFSSIDYPLQKLLTRLAYGWLAPCALRNCSTRKLSNTTTVGKIRNLIFRVGASHSFPSSLPFHY